MPRPRLVAIGARRGSQGGQRGNPTSQEPSRLVTGAPRRRGLPGRGGCPGLQKEGAGAVREPCSQGRGLRGQGTPSPGRTPGGPRPGPAGRRPRGRAGAGAGTGRPDARRSGGIPDPAAGPQPEPLAPARPARPGSETPGDAGAHSAGNSPTGTPSFSGSGARSASRAPQAPPPVGGATGSPAPGRRAWWSCAAEASNQGQRLPAPRSAPAAGRWVRRPFIRHHFFPCGFILLATTPAHGPRWAACRRRGPPSETHRRSEEEGGPCRTGPPRPAQDARLSLGQRAFEL